MDTSLEKKHLRFLAQTKWTKAFREYLYRKLPDDRQVSILEVGCGTGAVIQCIKEEFPARAGLLTGIDIDRNALNYTKKLTKENVPQADGISLPFADKSFDFVYCHYLLLWTKFPERVLSEMRRVTKAGGLCAAMAEPDYGEMIAAPDCLRRLAEKQIQSLSAQGANLFAGHRLGEFFRKAGFYAPGFGCYEQGQADREFLAEEIRQMREDCGDDQLKKGFRFQDSGFKMDDFREALMNQDSDHKLEIDRNVQYVYNIPTYYAWAVNDS